MKVKCGKCNAVFSVEPDSNEEFSIVNCSSCGQKNKIKNPNASNEIATVPKSASVTNNTATQAIEKNADTCRTCGAELKQNAKYCTKCGALISSREIKK